MKIALSLLLLTTLALLVTGGPNRGPRYVPDGGSQRRSLAHLCINLSDRWHPLRQSDALRAGWRQKLAATAEVSVHREQIIASPVDENAAFRRRYSAALPEVVRRSYI